MERRLGFAVSRPTITIDGPFQQQPRMDAKWAHATVETQGDAYRVAVTISGPSETCIMGSGDNRGPTDDELEEARAFLALAELAQRSPGDFAPPGPGLLAEIRVSPKTGPDSGPGYTGMWSVDSLRQHPALREYTVEHRGGRWTAKPQPAR